MIMSRLFDILKKKGLADQAHLRSNNQVVFYH